MKRIPMLFICLATFAALSGQSAVSKEEHLEQWKDARFGMFIHWGIYALAARNEWVKNEEMLTDKE